MLWLSVLQCDPGLGTTTLFELLYTPPVKHLVLGPLCSDTALVQGQATHRFNIPHVRIKTKLYRRQRCLTIKIFLLFGTLFIMLPVFVLLILIVYMIYTNEHLHSSDTSSLQYLFLARHIYEGCLESNRTRIINKFVVRGLSYNLACIRTTYFPITVQILKTIGLLESNM